MRNQQISEHPLSLQTRGTFVSHIHYSVLPSQVTHGGYSEMPLAQPEIPVRVGVGSPRVSEPRPVSDR